MPYDAPFYQTCCGDEDDDTALSRPHYARQAEAARATTIPRFSSEEELERNLKPHLPELEQALRQTRPLGDSVFPLVAELLAQHGKGEWSLRPRTFAVLKILGCPELLDDFVKEGRYDSALPYTDGNLPSAVKGSTLRNKFLKLQALVACQESDIAALEEGGKHLHLLRPGDEYFRDRRSLGGGRQGIVESVVSLRSARPFVRKCFSRGLSVLLDSTVLREFEAELNSLKRLCHDHIVKLVGSYTDSDTVGIVMTPVADCDLEEFLRNAATDPIVRKRLLRPFFGCLATALAYLHSQRVRHNDIKPENILVKGSTVYLTDFGMSRAWGTNDQSTTTGNNEGFTKRYKPPEMLQGENGRNTASDIWSLGCVFLEMATVLADRSINDIDRFFETHGTQNVTFLSQNQEAIRLWIKDLQTQSSMSSQDLKTLGWISRMLQYPVDERPTAAQLRGNIIDDSSEHLYICSKCMTPDGIKGTDTVKAVSQQLAPVTASSLGLSERPPTKPPKTEASDVEGETARRRDGGEPHRQVTALQTIRRINSHDQDFIQPSPVKPPPYLRKDSIPLPTATMVPSYIRAGMNHPSKEMLDEAQTYNPQGSNLFVYGRLMFPAMLHALAAASVKGVYAPQLRRRLYPSTADWSHADISIKNACDAMVPARLTGYDRWRPKGLNCAVIKDSRFTPRIMEHIRDRKGDTHTISPSPTGEVDGFLILGVRSDALRYCDLLFSTSEQTLWSMTPPADDDSDSESSHAQRYIPCLRRRQVKVSLEQADGTIRSVSAETYVWTESVSSLQSTWSEDRFVRSTVMQNVLSTVPSWTYEENQLALEMHITLALVGDYLCAAISAGNIAALSGLLNDNFDANAPCRLYGFPLHAAIVADKDDMVRLLIAHGADLEAPSKRYGTPLITAVVHNRIGIAKLLMHHGAKVLASDERHVNALYQAVKHGNYALTETLLEHGAWLSLNWREIMDLAEDGGSGDMVRLLKIYDVKGRARDKRERSRSSRDERLEWRSEYSDSWETVPYSDVGMAVLRRLGTVSQMPYNWKGRRAVELTIAALEAGAPMRLLGLIREAIHPIKAILDMLRRSDEHHGQDIVVPRRAIALERDREPSPRGRVPEIIQTEDGARSLEMAARNLRIRPSRPPPYFRGARSDVDVEENRTIGRERERDRHRGRDGDYSRERDHGRERDHEHRRYGDHLTVPGQEEQGIRRAVSIDERTLGERRRRPDRRRSETRDGRRESLV